MMGRISSWAVTHGAITPDDGGPDLYVSAADCPRNVEMRAGLRVSYKPMSEVLPDENSMARAVMVVLSGDDDD